MHTFDSAVPARSTSAARTTPHSAVAPAGSDRRPLAAVLLALLTALFMLVSTVQPAAAHDEMISSDPESGAALEASPEALTLTFSGNVMDIGREVRVTDSTGESQVAQESTVDRQKLIQPLDNPGSTEDETYTVVWRVVSEDGHPIEGTFDYTVGAGAGEVADQGPTQEQSATPTGDDRDDSASEAAEPAAESGTPGWPIPVIGGVGALALLIVVLVLATRRKKN